MVGGVVVVRGECVDLIVAAVAALFCRQQRVRQEAKDAKPARAIACTMLHTTFYSGA